MMSYYAAMERTSVDVLRLIALALNLSENFFDDKVDRHSSNLQVANYPSQPISPWNELERVKPHADSGTITILDREVASEKSSGGLEVLDRDDQWRKVPSREGELLVNLGNLMARWSNDHWVSTKHRVTNPRTGDSARRMSIAYFQKPNYTALCDPRSVAFRGTTLVQNRN